MTTGEPPVSPPDGSFNKLNEENDGKGNIKPVAAGHLFFFG